MSDQAQQAADGGHFLVSYQAMAACGPGWGDIQARTDPRTSQQALNATRAWIVEGLRAIDPSISQVVIINLIPLAFPFGSAS